jgi:hypothetical protein
MSTPNTGFATKSRATAWSGASGNVVVENHPVSITAISFNGGAGGGTVRVFDNATTNSGNVLVAFTLVAGQIDTFIFPVPLKARNGVTINSSAVLGAGSVHAF